MSIKPRFLILYFFALIHFGCSQIQPVDYVDVFIGTSNSRWMLGPYACVPFGMVQLGPDNQGDVWMGGYEYSINNVRAFSHIHAWTMSGLAIMPKDSAGNWIENFSPFSGYSFSEGNAWQYSCYVPHDIPELVELLGRDSFSARLEYGFQQAERKGFAAHAFDRSRKTIHEYYVNHGNQANMQAAFLFNYAGKPWLTQKYSRKMLDVFYGATPYHGWDGDEDEGQMGAWYVMSAMGLFEMTGGTSPDLPVDLSSPLFDKITIALDTNYYKGEQLIIETRNNAKENVYIQKISLNGNELDKPRVSFTDLVNGGHLIFDLGPLPNQ